MQPPSGSCVLKLHRQFLARHFQKAAAFGQLCVETIECVISLNKRRSRLRAAVC